MKFRIGCSGWSYTAWKGHFYPTTLESNKWLEYYSKIFDTVEIDSSFYRIPNEFMVKRWAESTPENFRFTAKFPKVITHEKRLADVEGDLAYFFKAMRPLAEKTLCLVLQMAPSMTKNEGLKKLKNLIHSFDPKFRYAVEARHETWFDAEVYELLRENDVCLAWSQLAEIQTPTVVTANFVCLRLIGDRTISESDFGKIMKDRTKEMEYWAREIEKLKKARVSQAIVVANNHYMGFGPATANIFRKMVGLSQAVYEAKKQARISDF